MKRALIGLVAGLALLFIGINPISAATYSCSLLQPGTCDLDFNNICPPGSGDEPQINCRSKTDEECRNAVNITCPDVTPPEHMCYACVQSACTLVNPDNWGSCPYAGTQQGLNSCNIGCTQPLHRFKCVNNSCVADTHGEYASAADCETICAHIIDTTSPICGTGIWEGKGVDTAIGCLIAGDPKKLIGDLLGWGSIVGGGIAFLMIIFAGFQIATATGDPKRVKAGQELITSAISGLILIVLSVILLNFIGVSVLGLSSLGFSL